ncbi:MAG TPA: Flp family type IVb pilin [Vineibacter sp.]|nr:Flp family type IVb pilin [Vineibacter sp.]
MVLLLRKLLKDETGATAIEYGLIVVLTSTAAIAGYSLVGNSLNTSINNIAGKL